MFQSDPRVIRWRLHFRSEPARVYEALATAEGRSRFWAETALESEDVITFQFVDGQVLQGRVLVREPSRRFSVEYFDMPVTFELTPDGTGGTDLLLCHELGIDDADYWETVAGWVSVLMAMKAAVDHGVDLRNHDERRSWSNGGYVDN